MTNGEPVTGIEVAGQRPDQDEDRAWVTYWHPVRGRDGKIVGVNVAAEEITERKRVEAALRASERQFHTLADSIPQLVWMAEPDGRIFWFNRHWYDYTGAPHEAANALDWHARLAPASAPDARRRWAQSLYATLEMELSLLGKDEQYRPFLTLAIPLARRDVYRLPLDRHSHRYQRAETPREAHPLHHRRSFASHQESPCSRHGGRQPDRAICGRCEAVSNALFGAAAGARALS